MSSVTASCLVRAGRSVVGLFLRDGFLWVYSFDRVSVLASSAVTLNCSEKEAESAALARLDLSCMHAERIGDTDLELRELHEDGLYYEFSFDSAATLSDWVKKIGQVQSHMKARNGNDLSDVEISNISDMNGDDSILDLANGDDQVQDAPFPEVSQSRSSDERKMQSFSAEDIDSRVASHASPAKRLLLQHQKCGVGSEPSYSPRPSQHEESATVKVLAQKVENLATLVGIVLDEKDRLTQSVGAAKLDLANKAQRATAILDSAREQLMRQADEISCLKSQLAAAQTSLNSCKSSDFSADMELSIAQHRIDELEADLAASLQSEHNLEAEVQSLREQRLVLHQSLGELAEKSARVPALELQLEVQKSEAEDELNAAWAARDREVCIRRRITVSAVGIWRRWRRSFIKLSLQRLSLLGWRNVTLRRAFGRTETRCENRACLGRHFLCWRWSTVGGMVREENSGKGPTAPTSDAETTALGVALCKSRQLCLRKQLRALTSEPLPRHSPSGISFW